MTGLAFDALSTSIDPAAAKQAGYEAFLGYTRVLTADVCQRYINAGLGVATIFEYQADESLQGSAKGTADGQLAAQQLTALGQEHGTLHVVNLADFAPTPSQLPTIVAYWQAYVAQTSAWHVIPYGPRWLLDAMGVKGWQNAMDDNGEAGDVVSANAVVYQRVTPTRTIAGTTAHTYDEDVVLADLPWWGLTIPVPPAPFIAKETHMFVAAGLPIGQSAAYLVMECGKIVLPDPDDLGALCKACGQAGVVPLHADTLAAIPDAPK